MKIFETASDHDYSCYHQLALPANLFAARREQISCKPTITPIVDHDDTLLRTDWRSISYLKASLTTARELDLIAVTGDLYRLELLGVREQNADGEDGDTERGVGIESL